MTHNKADWVNNWEHMRQQNDHLELLQRELLILQMDYPETRVNLRQVQTTVSELQKRTAYFDRMNKSYLKVKQEVRATRKSWQDPSTPNYKQTVEKSSETDWN